MPASAANESLVSSAATLTARVSLLNFLLIQTYLDGGTAYATAYRDAYDVNNVIPKLLKDGKCGKKLLEFIESNEECRQCMSISNRDKPPHLVSLTDGGLEYARKLVDEFQCSSCAEYNKALQYAAEKMEERLIYRLRQNYCKLRRRKAKQRQQTIEGDDTHITASNYDDCADSSPTGASLPWLIKKCPKELHMYARLLPNRPMNVLPFSKEWYTNVEVTLHEFVQGREDDIFVIGERNGVINIGLVQHLQGQDDNGDGDDNGTCNSIDLVAIRTKLVSILRQRGNPVGGLDVGNVLTDPKMRSLLGGRDLTTVIQEIPDVFNGSVENYQDEKRNGVWYVRLGESVVNTNAKHKSGKNLLWADDVGTYSLTDAKSALVMAKLLASSLDTSTDSSNGMLPPSHAVAIDLTAGVGGNTIGLAKIFNKVVAYELDSSRFEYLKKNIDERVDASNIDIELRCGDSVAALDALAIQHICRKSECGGRREISCPIAVCIDPPFGGIHYRRQVNSEEDDDDDVDEGLALGDTSLSEVVRKVANKLQPCVVGLKLPLIFGVDRFVERLRSLDATDESMRTYSFEIATMRRLPRNLFVVIRVAG